MSWWSKGPNEIQGRLWVSRPKAFRDLVRLRGTMAFIDHALPQNMIKPSSRIPSARTIAIDGFELPHSDCKRQRLSSSRGQSKVLSGSRKECGQVRERWHGRP